MRTVKTDYIGRKRKQDVSGLIRASNLHDGTHYGMIEDADGYALAYQDGGKLCAAAAFYRMGETFDGQPVCELAAFTAPEYRRQHCFTKLMERLSGELDGSVLRFAVYPNEDASAVLAGFGAVHDHDELMLETGTAAFSEAAGDGEIPEGEKLKIDFEEGYACSKHSECYFRLGRDSAYVFGVLSYARHRRKGYAREMLKQLFSAFYEKGIFRVRLQVSSENLPALRLYESLGMKETDRLEYHLVIK
jgi:RimJ/RimL family protein N-acetyltransferase